ncbi:MAG: NAD(P)-binding domain-containing protein, partial [Acidimicrobiia bacterium]|nr:NAD(P)-binding domain-containing protein [Acidimicrobiia bacterium]
DWFEMGSDIGGNWRYNNDNGRSAAYDSLHIDTSKERMAYSDFPMPADYPAYPHHSQVFDYFNAYVDHFQLRDRVTFNTEVVSVVAVADGRWSVRVRRDGTESVAEYGAVIVANGHHWNPRVPEFPGMFAGESMHSRSYRSPDDLRGKRVLVLGIGNSGSDIACDLVGVASEVFLASRRGAHIIPRYLFGRPVDTFTSEAGSKIPFPLTRAVYQVLLWLARGRQTGSGIAVPDHKLLSEHPTLSQDLLKHARAGAVVGKPNIDRFEGDTVHFVDGTSAEVDVIIFATGYQITFPFLDSSIIDPTDNQVELYQSVIPPDHRGLYFIGLIQPLGAIMPLAELQAKWVANLIEGAPRPSADEMHHAIDATRQALAERYVESPRHTIQVDFFPYKQTMEREIAATEP